MDTLARGAAGLSEADQKIGVAIAADFFLIHVGEQKVLRFGVAFGHAGVDVSEIVRERTDIVKMVLRPARKMRAAELAALPRRC